MRKASVHPGSGLSEECSATTLPHADPHYASECATHTHTHLQICRHPDADADPEHVHALSHLLPDCQKHKHIIYTCNVCLP